jgi:serine/threonine-protein kinase
VESVSLTVLMPGLAFHGRYRVVRCIKAGGMGAVYEVIDEATNTRRAMKVMLPILVADPDLRARFSLEAKITGGIESDHITHISDAGIDEATTMPFMVMDLLRGEDLGALVHRRGALPPAEVVVYLHQAALALERTHAAGIVHRDLKPENLFLTLRDDGSPCVKILDFGVAKVIAAGEQRATRSVGTPLYMAPEQVRGDRRLGPRTDIYALGLVAYTLLVGEPYWEADKDDSDSPFPLMSRIVEGPKEPPCARAARRRGIALPPAFDGWFLRAVAPRPEDRFEGALAAVAALAVALRVSLPRPVLPTSEPPPPSAPGSATVPLTPTTPARWSGVSTPPTTPPPAVAAISGEPAPGATPRPKRRGLPAAVTAMALTVALLAAGLIVAALLLRGGEPDRPPQSAPEVPSGPASALPPEVRAEGSAEPEPPAPITSALAVPASSASAAPAVSASAAPATGGSAAPKAPRPGPAKPPPKHHGIF